MEEAMKKFAIPVLRFGFIMGAGVVLLICATVLPELAEFYAEIAPEWAYLRYPLLLAIYSTLVPFMAAVFFAMKLTFIIQRCEEFSEDAVFCLKAIRICALVLAIMYITGTVILSRLVDISPPIGLLVLMIILASVMVGSFAGILEELLRKVIGYKEEIELTV
jgi:hypothetical protein